VTSLKKLDHSISYSETFDFDRFRGGSKTRAKFQNLKIQCVLMHGKRLRGIKEPNYRMSKPNAAKTDCPVLDTSVRSFQNR
jgi:hypothetical protein